ncbi:MAG: nucleotidyl transferase AbiEii/AbiGii toxin family protein [Candidatus Doudnabacteria bacterium]|nr:nucleotidyl transferase AbiEii/AbiGii toxin family protein [Candidatus Doudnabacteria bacterium]
MQNLRKEILTIEQIKLLPLLGKFSRDFGLVGGTAIALYLGHRRSIDFDMFTGKSFSNAAVRRKIKNTHTIQKTFKDESGQYTFFINNAQFTFYHYPYALEYPEKFGSYAKMPDLLTLAAMKAFALGGRNKWKDYVDLYFILKDYFSLTEISHKAKQLFAGEFNERIFRNELAYFDDINYAEQVEFMPGFEVADEIIKKQLTEFSLQ